MHINSKKESNKILTNLYERRKKEKNPVGYFELFDKNNKKIFSNDNLVVGAGRQYVAQKTVSSSLIPSIYSLTDLPSGCDNLREFELTHYAFGGGGAVVTDSIDTYQLVNPTVCDIGLNRPISFGVSSYLNDPGNIDELDNIHTSSESVKPINSNNNTFEYNLVDYDDCSYYTQFQFTLFKESGEFGVLDAGESVQVSEAGLYITRESDVLLFAKICFPPKFMEKEAQYGIEWYVLC